MKQKLSTIAFVAALLLAGVGTSFGQLSLNITNNSFEIPASAAQFIYIGGGTGSSGYMTGWTTVATEGGYWNTRNTNGSLNGSFTSIVTNVDAAQVLEAYNVGGGEAGYIYQELPNLWVPGATYTMTARAGQPPGGNPPNTNDTFSIDANNAGTLTQLSYTNIANTTNGLLNYSVTYTATGSEIGDGHIVVAFHVPHQPSAGGMWIDDFAISQDPAITNSPVSVVVVPGNSTSFSAPATGATTVSYQWQATNSLTGGFTNVPNAGAFSGATSPTLHITSAQSAQALAYQVVVSDTAGTITSSVVNLTLTDPFISVQPVSQTSNALTTVSFSVTAQGASTLHYQWQTNNGSIFVNVGTGGVVSGATTSNLTLTAVTPNYALTYDVVVSDLAGSSTSAPVTLTLISVPIITSQPVSASVSYGAAATFSVGAVGPSLAYQWQSGPVGGPFVNVVNGGHFSGATTSSLTVSNANNSVAPAYQVIVSNSFGSVTSSPAANLVVGRTLVNVQYLGKTGETYHDGVSSVSYSGPAVVGSAGDTWNAQQIHYYSNSGLGGGATANLFTGAALVNSVNAASGLTLSLDYQSIVQGAAYTLNTDGATDTSSVSNLMQSCVSIFTYTGDSGAGNAKTVHTIGGLSSYAGQTATLVVYAAAPTARTEEIDLTGGATGGNSGIELTTSSTSRSLSDGVGVAYQIFTNLTLNGNNLVFTVNDTSSLANGDYGMCNGFQLLIQATDPTIAVNPVSRTNVISTTATFSVTANGSLPISYQWQATNSASGGWTNLPNVGVYSGSQSNVLTITGVNTNQGLAYQVLVANSDGTVTSTPAFLTVLTVPLITSLPASQTVVTGGSASFTVGATGAGSLSYYWLTNGVPVGNGGSSPIVSGATTPTLGLTNVTATLLIQAVVVNANGSVTSSPAATLTVLPATELIDVDIGTSAGTQSGAAVIGASGDIWNGIAAGGSFSPVVNAGGNTLPGVTVVPQVGVTSYDYNGTGGAAVDPGTANLMNDFMFSFNPSVPFTVSVTGLSPYINSPFALVVYSAMGANQGATITLAGATGGTSTNTVTTSGATKQLSLGIGVAYQIFTGIVTNGTLALTLSANNDPNFHGCNGLQLLLSPTIQPIIITNPASVSVTAGSSASFSVGVLGTAPFGYQWQTNGVNIANVGGISGATSNILTIASASSKLVNLQVVVSNGSGSVTSAPVNLNIIPGPSLLGEWLTNSIGGVPNLAELTGTQPQHGGYVVGTSSLTLQAGQAPPNYAGDSVYFDGSEAVAISNTVSTDAGYVGTYDSYLTNAMTVAFWAQYVPQPGAYVSKNGVTAGWQFQQTNGGAPYSPTFSVVGTGSGVTNLAAVAVTNTLNDGNWHHYAGTWDGPSGIRKVYVDGVLATNLSGDTGPASAASAFRLVLGGLDTVGNDAGILTPFVGALYDVRIYNYALNQAQVTGLYSNVTVVPGLSTNANLTSLTLSPAGTLNPAFASSTLSYSATNAFGSTPTVTVVDADLTATNRLIYNNATNLLASGTPSSALSLTLGTPNVVKVQVTAQDGVTVKTYTVNVIEQPSLSPRPKLTNSVSSGVLNLNWGGQYLGYRLLQQTNNLSKGVSTNLTDWGTVAGTASLTATNITILKTNLDEYYRLVYP